MSAGHDPSTVHSGGHATFVATFPIEENLFHNEYLSTQAAFYCLTEGQSNRFV